MRDAGDQIRSALAEQGYAPRTRSLRNSAAKPKLASGVKNHGRHTCYRLDRFQVRERTGEILAGYGDARRDEQLPTTCDSRGRSSMDKSGCITTTTAITTQRQVATLRVI
jgi:hypothetical protein